MDFSNVQQMFSGKCVLITGTTGFVGKVLLEKLLRSCPGISQIMVLIRSNPKYTSNHRLQRLFRSSVFDRIKTECPEMLRKVRELDGDVTGENLKLSESDIQRVISEVHLVFHCAASVRFENNPRETIEVNVMGVKNVLTMCEKITKLMAVVHVSTAYSFCNNSIITEEIFEEKATPQQLEEILGWMNDEQLKEFCDFMSHSRPSFYQYSKAIAEICIKQNFSHLPIIIVRPSIITAAEKEPFPGWIDNYNGPSGFIALSSKGLLKTLLVKDGIRADWVPVDVVVNTIILSAYYIAIKKLDTVATLKPLNCSSGVPVINCVCPLTNSIMWSKIVKNCIPLLYKYPSVQIYSLPGGCVTSRPTAYIMYKYIYHYLPASILDLTLFLLFKQRQFVNNYKRIHKVLDFLQHYTINDFHFTTENISHLCESFPKEKETFPIDLQYLDWNKYLEDYVHGVRQFYLQEPDSTLPKARKKLVRLQYFMLFGKVACVGVLLIFLMKSKPRTGFTLPTINHFHKISFSSIIRYLIPSH